MPLNRVIPRVIFSYKNRRRSFYSFDRIEIRIGRLRACNPNTDVAIIYNINAKTSKRGTMATEDEEQLYERTIY